MMNQVRDSVEYYAALQEALYIELMMSSSTIYTTTMNVIIQQLVATAPCTPQQREALRLAPNEPYYPMIDDIRTSSNLEEFSLQSMGNWDVNAACRLIPDALCANESITKVTLSFMECSSSIKLRNDIFAALANRPRNLDELCLCFSSKGLSESTEFHTYLQSLTLIDSARQARTLGKLHFTGYDMTAPLCQLLFAQPHRGKIQHVVIDSAHLTPEAGQQFASYVQENSNTNNVGGDVVDVSVVSNYSGWRAYRYYTAGAFFLPSKGHVRVRSLKMTIGAFRHLPILTYYLPASLYINKLDLTLISNDGELYVRDEAFDTPYTMFHDDPNLRRRQLVDAIRRNGSLRTVKVIVTPVPDSEPVNFLTRAQRRLVRACMIRNKKLPKLLSVPRFKTDKGGDKDVNGEENGERGGGTTDLELFGTLFLASIVATSMAPTNVMIGLFSAVKEGKFT